jgi:hypothetical protein
MAINALIVLMVVFVYQCVLLEMEFQTWKLGVKCLDRYIKQLHWSARDIVYILWYCPHIKFQCRKGPTVTPNFSGDESFSKNLNQFCQLDSCIHLTIILHEVRKELRSVSESSDIETWWQSVLLNNPCPTHQWNICATFYIGLNDSWNSELNGINIQILEWITMFQKPCAESHYNQLKPSP